MINIPFRIHLSKGNMNFLPNKHDVYKINKIKRNNVNTLN